MQHKSSNMIEELTDPMLAEIIEEHEYVAVYFRGDCTSGEAMVKSVDMQKGAMIRRATLPTL